jgi:hypothetical protein
LLYRYGVFDGIRCGRAAKTGLWQDWKKSFGFAIDIFRVKVMLFLARMGNNKGKSK